MTYLTILLLSLFQVSFPGCSPGPSCELPGCDPDPLVAFVLQANQAFCGAEIGLEGGGQLAIPWLNWCYGDGYNWGYCADNLTARDTIRVFRIGQEYTLPLESVTVFLKPRYELFLPVARNEAP